MRSSCAANSISPALAKAREQLKQRLEAMQLRIDALQPLAKSHDSPELLNAMGEAIEQCLLTIDRTVMSSTERSDKE